MALFNPAKYDRDRANSKVDRARERERIWHLMNSVVGATEAGNHVLAQEYLSLLKKATKEASYARH